MTERFLEWLATKASDYLVWMHEREIKDAPICPDCNCPEPACYCAEEYERNKMLDSAFAAGEEHAYEQAQGRWS